MFWSSGTGVRTPGHFAAPDWLWCEPQNSLPTSGARRCPHLLMASYIEGRSTSPRLRSEQLTFLFLHMNVHQLICFQPAAEKIRSEMPAKSPMCLELSKLKNLHSSGRGALLNVSIYKKRWVVFQKLGLQEEGCQF